MEFEGRNRINKADAQVRTNYEHPDACRLDRASGCTQQIEASQHGPDVIRPDRYFHQKRYATPSLTPLSRKPKLPFKSSLVMSPSTSLIL